MRAASGLFVGTTIVVVAVSANGAPDPADTVTGAGTMRLALSVARGTICTGRGRGAGCVAVCGGVEARQATSNHPSARAAEENLGVMGVKMATPRRAR
jgi:hypothetical protein